MSQAPWEALAGSASRAPRTLETRERSEPRSVWTEQTLLPDPEPEDGWTFKWIRKQVRNDPDHNHFQKMLRQGWEPVRAEEHPELVHAIAPNATRGMVEIGDLVLCKMPTERVVARRQHYHEMNMAQLDSAESQYMSDSDSRMGKFNENKTNARRILSGGFNR